MVAADHPAKPRVRTWKHLIAAAYRWTFDRGQPMPAGIPEKDPRVAELVRRYEDWEEEDQRPDRLARAAAWAKIRGDGKNPDGTRSAEATAYVDLCCAQVRANLSWWDARNRAAMSGGAAQDEREAMRDLQRALGISATEAADG